MIDLAPFEDDLFAYGCMGLLCAFMATAIGCDFEAVHDKLDLVTMWFIVWLWISSPIALLLAWWI